MYTDMSVSPEKTRDTTLFEVLILFLHCVDLSKRKQNASVS